MLEEQIMVEVVEIKRKLGTLANQVKILKEEHSSRELSIAYTKLQEAEMWLNKAV